MTTPSVADNDTVSASQTTPPVVKKTSWLRRLLGVLLIIMATLLVVGLIIFGVVFWVWQQGAQMVSTVYGGPLPNSVMPVLGVEDDAHRHRLAVIASPKQQLMLLMVQSVSTVKPKKTGAEPTPTNVNTQDFMALLSQWSNDSTMDPTIAMYLKQAQASSGIQIIKMKHTSLPALSLSALSLDTAEMSSSSTNTGMDSLITILPASGQYPETLVLGLNPQGKMTPELMSTLLAPMPRFADPQSAGPSVK